MPCGNAQGARGERGPGSRDALFELDAAIAQTSYLEEVGRLRGLPGVPTATLAGDPLYRTVYQAWLMLRRAAEGTQIVLGKASSKTTPITSMTTAVEIIMTCIE